MSLIWCGCEPPAPRPEPTIPPRRIGDRLPVLRPRGMTTFEPRTTQRSERRRA